MSNLNCKRVHLVSVCIGLAVMFFAPSICGQNITNELNASYYEGTWDEMPDFDDLTPVSSNVTIGFDISNASVPDGFGYRFDGFIQIDVGGRYDFYLKSDDGSKLYVDGEIVVTNNALDNTAEVMGSLFLDEGFHEICVDYFHKAGSELLEVSYAHATIAKQLISAEKLASSVDSTVSGHWFSDSRYGMFIHWGPYVEHGGDITISWSRTTLVSASEYDQLYTTFNPTNFDASALAQSAVDAGMKYVTMVGKHHDGFSMWDTAYSSYSIMNAPIGRDLLGELAAACKAKGLRFEVYYSIADWYQPSFHDDLRNPDGVADEAVYYEYIKNQCSELVTNYDVDGIWYDWDMGGEPWSTALGQALNAHLRSLKPSLIFNNRADGETKSYQTVESKVGAFERFSPWETVVSMSENWSWHAVRTLTPFSTLLPELISSASGSGNYMLNVTPNPQGTLDADELAIMGEFADWMALYGDSVYGTRGGPFKPKDAFSSTCKGDRIYLFLTQPMAGGELHLPSIPNTVLSVNARMGGTAGFTQDVDGITVMLPDWPVGESAMLIEMQIDGLATAIDPLDVPDNSLSLGMPATASSTWFNQAAYLPGQATDGDAGTRWSAANGDTNGWLEVDLGEAYSISQVYIKEFSSRIASFELQVRAATSESWTVVHAGTVIGEEPGLTVDFEPVTARYVHLNILGVSGVPSVYEFKVFEDLFTQMDWSIDLLTKTNQVLSTGTLIEALNLGTSASSVAVNGVDFVYGRGTVDSSSFETEANWETTDAAMYQGDVAVFDLLLDPASWRGGTDSHSYVLTGLTVGKEYMVQLFVADDRSPSAGRRLEVDGVYVGTCGGSPLSVVGIFTALEPEVDFSLQVFGADGTTPVGGHLNAIQLREFDSSLPSNVLQQWQVANWGSFTVPDALPDADPDGDGLINRLEYLMGSSPTAATDFPGVAAGSTNREFVVSLDPLIDFSRTMFQFSFDQINWHNADTAPAHDMESVRTTDEWILRDLSGTTRQVFVKMRTYTLAEAQEAPVANDDACETGSNTLFTNAAPGILSNDTDASGDTLSAILVAPPVNGTLLSFSDDGSFVYQPDTDFTGTDTFTYKVTDGNRESISATVGIVVTPASTGPLDFYVAITGDDANDGSDSAPFRSLARAQLAVRSALPSATEEINVRVGEGTYYLDQALEFGPLDSGSASVPVSYAGVENETVILSGGIPLSPVWSIFSGDIQVADVGTNLSFDVLFANDEQQVLARYPNYDAETRILNGYAADAISSNRVATWANPETGLVRGLHFGKWGGQSYTITGVNADGTAALGWVGDNNRGSGMHDSYRMVENIFEELDAPGEWFYDEPAGLLYFYPPTGMDLSISSIEAASTEELIRVVGSDASKVRYLTFDHFTFTKTRRTLFTRPYEKLLRSDWCVVRAGAVYLEQAENITVSDSRFEHLGGNGVFISGYNRNHLISSNEFLEVGATCVNLVGWTNAVRYASFWEDHKTDIADTTPGPQTEDYPKDITVSYNHMQDMGRFEKQTCGVNISMAESITVSHNTVHGSPRAGINVCDGTWGGHLFEYNDLFDCVRETSDHGPFNSWGRDRFWSYLGYNTFGSNGAAKKPYAFLDAWKTTVIRNNRIHYDEPTAFGIDLDDGSSNYEIYNNLLLNTSIKLREGFGRKVYNNISIRRGTDLHVWYDECEDQLYRNITVNRTAYYLALLTSDNIDAKLALIDTNLFYNGGDVVQVGFADWSSHGLDVNSIVADPLFANPNALDYSVAANSPAVLSLGFINFPMDQFGKPGAPEPDPISTDAGGGATADPEPLMGADACSIYDASIQSAVGAPDFNGVYLETVPSGSYAEDQGFVTGDVIRSINGVSITDKPDFWAVYNMIAPGESVSITLLHNQIEQPFSFVKTPDEEQLNDTAGIVYSGSWPTQVNVNSFNDDLRYTSGNGNYFEFTFYGTAVSFQSQKNSDMGNVEVYIDTVLDQTISCYNASRLHQQTVYSVSNLTAGVHTLKAVNAEAKYMILDSIITSTDGLGVPVATDDAYETEVNISFTNAAPGILSNDTGGDGALSAILVTLPVNGTLLSFSADGSFVYQPAADFTGTDTFTYEAVDAGGLTGNVATVSIEMTASSAAPVELIYNGDLEMGTDHGVKSGLFECKWWHRRLNAEGNYTLWLAEDSGNQVFEYGWGASYMYQDFRAKAGESYQFSIDNYNSAGADNRWQAHVQVEWYDSAGTRIGNAVTVAEEDNDTSPAATWNTLSGSAAAPANTAYAQILVGCHDKGDGSYWNRTQIDNISVVGVPGTDNLPCSFMSSPDNFRLDDVPESEPYNDALLNYTDDKDGDVLTFTPVNIPAWMTIAADGTMSGTPQFADAGEYEIVVSVADGNGASDTRTFYLLVVGFLDLANLFDDDMVLQRNEPVPVMGVAVSNTWVTVTMSSGESASTTSDANGSWALSLPAMPATTNGAATMTVTSGSRTMTVTNILVGDVWLCSGQSNMGFSLSGADGGAAEIATASYPNLRLVLTPGTKAVTPWDDLDVRAAWQECTPAVAGNFSAVAYYFGKSIMLDQNIPIGLIHSSQGGTVVEHWAAGLVSGIETFYNSRIHPYANMPIKGAIWYQGEANVGDGAAYTPKLQTLVDDWRSVWGAGAEAFPFYFVQLAPNNYNGDEIYELPQMWAAQTEAAKRIANSGMAIINDVGNITDIHPTNKKPVGERLALWAKYGTYGQTGLVHSGPLMRDVNREDNQLRISFDHVGGGLVARDDEPLNGFEIAGTNQIYVSATATVEGDTIVVAAPSVAEPEWVRFAWSEIAEPNLMNVEGLPAGAFLERRARPAPFTQEMLQNGGFETGTPTAAGIETFDAPPWNRHVNLTYYNSWLTDDTFDPIIGTGNQAVEITWGISYVYQDFAAIGGETYQFSIDVLNPTDADNRWTPQLHVEWYNSAGNPIGASVLLDQADNSTDPSGSWFELNGSPVAPGDAVTGRIRLIIINNGGPDNDSYFFDNASVIGALHGITYENWAAEKNTAAPLGDEDRDLTSNLEEYAYNLDPAVADRQIMVPATGILGLPCISFSGEHLQVEYLRRKEADDLEYIVQISTNLLSEWISISETISVESIDGEWERVIESDLVPAGDAVTARFIRMRVKKIER